MLGKKNDKNDKKKMDKNRVETPETGVKKAFLKRHFDLTKNGLESLERTV